jgi:hypothetical protein
MGFLLCSKKESFGYPESEGHTSGLLFDLSLFSSYPWIAAPFYLFSRLFRQGSFLNDNHDSTAAAAAAAAACCGTTPQVQRPARRSIGTGG